MVDVTPLINSKHNIIQAYSDKGFKVSGQLYDQALIVRPEALEIWDVSDFASLAFSDFEVLIALRDQVDVVLLGCGPTMRFLPSALKNELRAAGLHVEVMDNGAACRTYNALLADGRRVCAALTIVQEG